MLLAQRTLKRLQRTFDARNHRPSPAQWDALADLAATLNAMADGKAEPRFYLSSLDPGVGKTQTLIHFVDALLSLPVYEHVGVLICASRLSEVERMVQDIGLPPGMFAVVTSDAKLNAMGGAEVNGARVVITTQQMVERRLAERTYEKAGLFPFNDQPRAVRIWDEAFLPGQPLTLAADDLAHVLKTLVHLSAIIREDIKNIFNEVDGLPCGTRYAVPDFASKHPSITMNDALGLAERDEGTREDERAILSALWFLSGKVVTIRRDGRYGNTMLDYKETLPMDLAPMVILDASGRVRRTYRDMQEERGMLVPLAKATKRYDRLKVNVWQTGGGKSAFAKNAPELCAGIATAIETKPTEKWLVVAHKTSPQVGDTEKAVRSLLDQTPQENVSFITWGNHAATNAYADVPNIVLAGTLFYRGSFYEALKRLASGRKATAGEVTKEEVRETELGEHAHLILQALCRGAVRRCDGEHCHPAEAWVIASVRSGIPDALPSIFPGCQVVRWSPIPRKLKGHALAVCAYLEAWATSARVGDVMPFRQIQRALGIDARTFRDEVRRVTPLLVELGALGIEEHGKRNMTGYRLVSRSAAVEAVSVAA